MIEVYIWDGKKLGKIIALAGRLGSIVDQVDNSHLFRS